jgi:hypothetical protein
MAPYLPRDGHPFTRCMCLTLTCYRMCGSLCRCPASKALMAPYRPLLLLPLPLPACLLT